MLYIEKKPFAEPRKNSFSQNYGQYFDNIAANIV